MTAVEQRLIARLERLEARCRRERWIAILAGILWVAFPLVGQDQLLIREPLNIRQPIEEAIRARHISLVDDRGVQRAALTTDRAGSVFLLLFDRDGKLRTDIQVGNLGPSLNLYDATGRVRAVAGSTNLVASRVASAGGQVEREPASSLVLFDKDGKLLWRAP